MEVKGMKEWIKKHQSWLGIALALLIALYPEVFATIGTTIKFLFISYWSPVSSLIIILLLLSIIEMLKQQKRTQKNSTSD